MHTQKNLRFFNSTDSEYERLLENISIKLKELGFYNATQTLYHLQNKVLKKEEMLSISSEQKNTPQADILKNIQINILKLIAHNFEFLKNDEYFHGVVSLMTAKTKKFSCESVLKLALFCHSNKIIQTIYLQIKDSIDTTYSRLPSILSITKEEINKIFGYLLLLNLNKYSYMQIAFFSLTKDSKFNMIDKVKLHSVCYASFVIANHFASFDAKYSQKRREILYNAQLLETHLQRDPEEVEVYDAQMASSQTDKDKLLTDIQLGGDNNKNIIVIDIGPAGGATFKSVLATAYQANKEYKIGYYGIEYDQNELINLNDLLNNYTFNNLSYKEILSFANFIQGNALELSQIIESITTKNKNEMENQFLSIVFSSVIHEIYSYCPYHVPIKNTMDITTMTAMIASQYNPETIYKIYYEGLKTISEHPGKGSLNIRDGVMYKNPTEIVCFTLNNKAWVNLFLEFINDKKYCHLKDKISFESIVVGNSIKLEAKYVQEFMLKANWGPESFGNEINEVYCYLTLNDHIRLLQKAASELNINIDIPIRTEYTQQGYVQHINENKMSIISGFEKSNHFPPTNMVLKVLLKK